MSALQNFLSYLYRLFFAMSPRVALRAVYAALRRRLTGGKSVYVARIHPIDKLYGIDTSGYMGNSQLKSGNWKADAHNAGYDGVQPSVVRRILGCLPVPFDEASFVDFGCGKGRALVVASEYPFRAIEGVELAPVLAATARANAERMHELFPDRTRIKIIEGDALKAALPEGTVILYLYNPFFKNLLKEVIVSLEQKISANPDRKIFIVYANPVWASLFDDSKLFERYCAEQIPFEAEEIGSSAGGYERDEAVVVWQSKSGAPCTPHANAYAAVTVADHGWRARLVD